MVTTYMGSLMSTTVSKLGDDSLEYERHPTGAMVVRSVQQRYDYDVTMRTLH